MPKPLNQSSGQILQGWASGRGGRQGPGHRGMTQPSSVWAKVMGSQPLLGLQSIHRAWRRTAELWRGWRNHSSARLSARFSRGPASRNVTFFPAAPNTWEVLRVRQCPPPGVLSCQDRLERLEMVVGSCLGRVMPRSGGLGGLKVVPSSVFGFQVTDETQTSL